MIFILYLYIIGIILTAGYITIQLYQQLPDDVRRFKQHQKDGHLPDDDDSAMWFVFETLVAATVLSVVFPFFWYLESRRVKR